MSWTAILNFFSAALKALGIIGAYYAGKTKAENTRMKEDVDAAKLAHQNADSIRALSDAELDERLRKYTRK